jgi:methanethiol S-methyltransferase
MRKLLAVLYGVLAYLLFFGTFLYAICFIGGVFVPKTIDSGKNTSVPLAIAIDALLLAVFAIQHSVMARRGFKQKWTRVISWYVERRTYVIAASLALMLLLWQWRSRPQLLWDVRNTWAAVPLTILFWIGWAILFVSTFLINHFELFGLAQVWAHFHGQEFHRLPFKKPGLYRVVRHPIYFGFVIAFWSTPRMTVGHLVFSAAATGYILVGIFFEERDLLAAYGDLYREYRQRVPMLIPLPERSQRPTRHQKSGTADWILGACCRVTGRTPLLRLADYERTA